MNLLFKDMSAESAMARFLKQRRQIDAQRDANLAVARAAKLREIEALMASVFSASQDGILVVDANDIIVAINQAAALLFGESEALLTSEPLARMLPTLPDGGQFSGYRETMARSVTGRTFPVEVATTHVGTDTTSMRVLVLRDITERKSHEETLQHQATHDPLTGLPNRTLLARLVDQRLKVAAEEGQKLALLLLDLDHFKEINDTLGHDIGDDLLCQLGQRLTALIGSGGTVCRLGGDEFAVLIAPIPDAANAHNMALQLSNQIEAPFPLRDLSLSVGASVGIALYPEHADTMKDLLRCADVAMYEAKQSRTQASVYNATADRNSIRHLTLSGELKKAVEQRTMELYYQPKLSLTARRSLTSESLLRWTHPTLGSISPAEFVPQAEQTGLIGPLTDFTLETAIRQTSEIEAEGLAMSVAVNLSAQVIHNRALPKRVDELLRSHGLPAERLTLELTESAIMHDPEGALEVANEIAEIGVRLSIDDFGTGYSSLSYLSRLPAQELKIDRSFVSRMLSSASDALIVHSTIELAHSLGMVVVAEGIDQLDILNRLVALRCDYGQGFLIARPTPRAELVKTVFAAVRRAHDEWGIGVGGVTPDVQMLRAAASAELRRAAMASASVSAE